jgi:hypothetical protein
VIAPVRRRLGGSLLHPFCSSGFEIPEASTSNLIASKTLFPPITDPLSLLAYDAFILDSKKECE